MFRSLKKNTFATLTAAALAGSVGCGDAAPASNFPAQWDPKLGIHVT